MAQNGTKKKQLPVRLSAKAITLLQAIADEQGISKGAALEIIIRKHAEDVEEVMPAVYEILHSRQ